MTKIILDVDPGHDDAIAIMVAHKHPEIDLLGITVVSGNNSLEKTLRNTLNICTWLGVDVPISAGMDRPIVRDRYLSCDGPGDVHGETGLDGHDFGEITAKTTGIHAVEYIIQTVMASEEKITLVPTGPLSNIGMALRMEPKIIEKIERIVLMGGAYGTGNVTPSAEFNLYADPEAAHIVFSSGLPIVMMGLDLTRQASCTQEVSDKMAAIGNRASELFVNLMEFFRGTQKREFGWDAPPVHDPTTIVYLTNPELYETTHCNCQIGLSHDVTYGRTVCDMHHVTTEPRNTHVATKIDFDGFWEVVAETIRRYN